MKEKVSVLMSVYNEPISYIKCAIDSVVNQSYDNLEIIIVNDNPKSEVIRNYLQERAKADDRIEVVENNENMGLAASLNIGLKYAKGNYIARMDADDISFLDRIEKQMDYIKKNCCDLVSGFMNEMDSSGRIVHYGKIEIIDSNKIEHVLRYVDCVPHPLWLVKKSVYDALGGYREIHACEDYDFLVRMINHGYKIGMCNEVLLNYRVRDNSISNTNKLKQFLTAEYIRKKWEELEMVRMEDMSAYVKSKCNENENDKYMKALIIHNETVRSKQKYNIFIYLYCCLISKYYRIQLKNKIKHRLIIK